MAGIGEVEAGEPVGAVADNPDVEGLQSLESGRHIEDRLDTGADHQHAGVREGCEIRGLVPAVTRAAMHAAQPAGGEHGDARGRRQVRGRGDRRPAVPARAASTATSRTLTLTTSVPSAMRRFASSSKPTCGSPPMIAIVAGTAPPERTASSISRATRRLSGRGKP